MPAPLGAVMVRNAMDLPPIVQTGDPVLRSRASEVSPERIQTPQFQQLLEVMIAVMRAAPGVGLAAPQIGIPWRVIVLEDRDELIEKVDEEELKVRGRTAFSTRVFVNPVLQLIGEKVELFREGCLSVDGFSAQVERCHEVEVQGLDEHGVAQTWRVSGWPARILQHEVDHLNGTLYIDRMKTRSFSTVSQVHGSKAFAELKKSLGIE